MVDEKIALLLFPILLIGPFVFAIFVLRKLDQAAQLRRKLLVKTKFRFMIVDFLSLILLIQMPFHFLSLEMGGPVSSLLIFLSLFALTLVWFTTIRTVSEAGIVTFKWRALVSMVLVPTMYIGCFYFGITSINMLFGDVQLSGEMFVWLVVSLIGMVASPWIVRGALNSVDHSQPMELESKTPDPFAD